MIQVVEENGQAHVFGTRESNLQYDPSTPMFAAAVNLLKVNVHFRIALHDYMKAFSETLDCAFYCYRAIEALSSSFAPNKKNGWDKLNAALGTNEDEIKATIKQYADSARHGNWPSIRLTTSAERNAMLKLTRDILHKYMVWAGAD